MKIRSSNIFATIVAIIFAVFIYIYSTQFFTNFIVIVPKLFLFSVFLLLHKNVFVAKGEVKI